MNILDANIPLPERTRLAGWRLRFRQIGHELLPHHTQDADILPVLHRIGDVTFHTRDRDFWHAALCHESYCLAFYDVPLDQTAKFIRAFLRHPQFRTVAQRRGKVCHIHETGVSFYPAHRRRAEVCPWLAVV